jgi:hypothetical protein
MREQWVGYGYDAEAFDAALAGDSEAAITPDSSDGDGDIRTGPALSAAQVQDMIDALRAAGMPQDKIDEALAADGHEVAPDTRTDEEREFDASLGGRAAEAYKIDYLHRIPAGMTPTALAEANAAATVLYSVPQAGTNQALTPTILDLTVDLTSDPELLVNGQTIKVISASPSRVTVELPDKG